jgi:predicted metal-dependent phosphotriesterase family hydrolase
VTHATSSGMIRTVTGDIDPATLGHASYHEHLFQVSPLLPGDELDNEAASLEEAVLLRDSGFDAMVEATPLGLGRQPAAVARIAEATRLSIVHTTGRHREAHYPSGHWAHAFSQDTLFQRFVSDLREGLPLIDGETPSNPATTRDGEPVRAGLLKAGIGYWSISLFEQVTLEAVGKAHRETGAPVMIHLEHGYAAHEVLDLLATLQVPERSVALAHADRSLDAGLHVSLIERGAYLGYDGMGRLKSQSDEELLSLTGRVVEAVGTERILLGGDVARSSRYIAYGGMPGLEYLGKRYLPRLREKIGAQAVETMLKTNAASWLTWI